MAVDTTEFNIHLASQVSYHDILK